MSGDCAASWSRCMCCHESTDAALAVRDERRGRVSQRRAGYSDWRGNRESETNRRYLHEGKKLTSRQESHQTRTTFRTDDAS